MKQFNVPDYLKDYAHKMLNNETNNKDLYILGDDEARKKDEHDCIKCGPKTLKELTSGLILESYEFNSNEQQNLSLLGFSNVEFKKVNKIIVVEFLQIGKHICEGREYTFGVGARMLMRIKKIGWGAKINTPQQVTASVIFKKASVQFSLRTVGIVGPGTETLIGAGALSENTYNTFLSTVSNLIVESYKNEEKYSITPQLLFG